MTVTAYSGKELADLMAAIRALRAALGDDPVHAIGDETWEARVIRLAIDRLHQMNETARELERQLVTIGNAVDRVIERRDRAEAAIVDHNHSCDQSCQSIGESRDGCKAWTSRGRICSDCPKDWKVEYP